MPAQPNGIITLLTDFGTQDGYVACMKGVILGIAPHARLIDITHEVPPQAIGSAAYLLQTACQHFPAGAVHLAVVDPGVGSERRALAVAGPDAYYVGPDNGLLAPVVEDLRARNPDQVQVVELTEARYWRSSVSATFHGRDIFAPVAAHMVNGIPLARLGRPVDSLTSSPHTEPHLSPDGKLLGDIVHIDRFGNCVTSITTRHLRQYAFSDKLVVEFAGQRIPGLYRTYSDAPAGTLIALVGSDDHLEIAVPNGHAARWLGIQVSDRIRVIKRVA